jgi:signal transduction histidine kinase
LRAPRSEFPILYVDDDADNLIVFRSNFFPEFDVLTASSAGEALRLLERNRVSILITDQRMPGMTGVELCEQVRREHPWVRRVLLTAYGELRTAIDAINRGGVHSFLAKPWDKEVLRQTLYAQVEPLRLQREVAALRRALADGSPTRELSESRQRFLHDFGGLLQRLDLRSRKLERELEAADAEGLAQAQASTREVRQVVELLVQLHARFGALGVRAQTAEPERLRLLDVLRTVRELSGIEHGAVARFHLRCPEQVHVWMDRLCLVRVLLNLTANALEAIERAAQTDGEITIDVSEVGEQIQLDVSDNGPGIPPSLRSRIFDDHFTTRQASGGSGIGLSSARELAESCGGSLALGESVRGASFRLLLPAAPRAAHPPPPSPLEN